MPVTYWLAKQKKGYYNAGMFPLKNIYPDSWTAIELLRNGANFQQREELFEKASRVCAMAGLYDKSFVNGAILNIAKGADPAEIRETFAWLAKNNPEPRVINIMSCFKNLVDKHVEKEKPRVYAYLCRGTSYFGGHFHDPFANDLLMRHGSKIVRMIAAETGCNPEKTGELFRIQKEMVDVNYKKLGPWLDKVEQLSESQEAERMARAKTLKMLGMDATSGWCARGVRRWGKDFMARIKILREKVKAFDLPYGKEMSLLARCASGKWKNAPETGWLVYLDKTDPFSWNIDDRIAEIIKLRELAIKCAMAKADPEDIGRETLELLKDTKMIAHSGGGRELTVSLLLMAGRGILAARRYGDEDEGWQAYLDLETLVKTREKQPGMRVC